VCSNQLSYRPDERRPYSTNIIEIFKELDFAASAASSQQAKPACRAEAREREGRFSQN
jgi:hypothetical protein